MLLVHPAISVKRQKCPLLILKKKNITFLSPSPHLRFPSSSFGSALSFFFLLLHLPHLPASSHFFFFLLLLDASSSCAFFFLRLLCGSSSSSLRRCGGGARKLPASSSSSFFLLLLLLASTVEVRPVNLTFFCSNVVGDGGKRCRKSLGALRIT